MEALILTDIQNDFLPGGALAVPRGDEVVEPANRLASRFELVVATQDWHPPGHGSFASSHEGKKPGDVIELAGLEQVLWPDHCVQGTHGAAFAPGLSRERIAEVFRKGDDPDLDSYSGFFDNGHRRATGLGDYLKAKGAGPLYIVGLALDYCVKYTALDARRLGFETVLVLDACRGIDLKPGDVHRAVEEMQKAGVTVTDSEGIPGHPDSAR